MTFLGSEVVVGSAGSFKYYEEEGVVIQYECYGSRCYRNGPVVIDEVTLAYWRNSRVRKGTTTDAVQQRQILQPDEIKTEEPPEGNLPQERLCENLVRD